MRPLDAAREAGAAFSRVTERWVPDAWVICMILTALALLLAMGGAGASLEEVTLAWGAGVWNLLALAMQFSIAMVAASACVASKPVFRALDRLAALPEEYHHAAYAVAALGNDIRRRVLAKFLQTLGLDADETTLRLQDAEIILPRGPGCFRGQPN